MNELRLFFNQPRNTRILLLTSLIYAFVLPVIDIFVAAYIMRNSQDVARVVIYQLTVYSGIPLTFLINGYLLNKICPNKLYAFGMLLSGISMYVMTSLPDLNYQGIAFAGLIMGMSFGFFWSNRDYLVLISTNDENRNYYYGLETFFNTFTFVIVPICIGWFIEKSISMENITTNNKPYQLISLVVIGLTIIASYFISKGNYPKPIIYRFLYFKSHPLWNKMLAIALSKGLVQGFIVTAPAMLIMKLVGEEGTLGSIQSFSSIITAFMMYLIGRKAKPENRITIYTIAVILFVVGTVVNTIFFNAYSAIFLLLCMIIARPLYDLAYFPIQMQIIDYLSKLEERSEYFYILSHEVGLYLGRFLGCITFILLAIYVSDKMALIITLPLVTVLQASSSLIVKNIITILSKN